MKVHQYHIQCFGFSRQHVIHTTKRAIQSWMHEHGAHDVEHANFNTVTRRDDGPARARRIRWIVVRPQKPRLILNQLQCFAFIPDMVAGGQQVDLAIFQQLVEHRGGHAKAASSIFGIDNGQFRIKVILDFGKMASQCPSARLAENITDKQNLHGLT